MTFVPDRVPSEAVTVTLLAALGTLADGERTAWIDRHITGIYHPERTRKAQIVEANRKLRRLLVSAEALREAA